MARNRHNDYRYAEGGYEIELDPALEREMRMSGLRNPVCLECGKNMSYKNGDDGMCNRCVEQGFVGQED